MSQPKPFAEVALYVPHLMQVYDYRVPPTLEPVQVGQLVEVPVGPQNRPTHGVVLGRKSRPAIESVKPILGVVDPEAVLTEAQIALARRLAHETLCGLAEALAPMLPPGVAQWADTEFRPSPKAEAAPAPPLPRTQARVLTLLRERGPLRRRQLARLVPPPWLEPALQALERLGLIVARAVLPRPKARPRQARYARLAVPPEQAQARREQVAHRPETRRRRQALLDALLEAHPEPSPVSWLYAATGAKPADLRALARQGLVEILHAEALRDPLARLLQEPGPAPVPPLTPEQQAAWDRLTALWQPDVAPATPVLLHGITGAGKTELYLRAVARALEHGRQALVLVPEISLTPQMVRAFAARFPGQVGLLHSRLPLGERYDTWRRARRGELAVLLGPRSAVFAPLPRLGLIVVDECHAEAYYPGEQPPFWHAREIARVYAELTGSLLLLGSATPDVVTYARARRENWPVLRLQQRVPHPSGRPRPLPQVHIVDMREELRAGNRSIFSRALQQALETTLAAGQQALLFLNRRGHATHVFCRTCGAIVRCPRCQVPLAYHHDRGKLVCHHCGYSRGVPRTCPACGSRRIGRYGTGTQRVEEEVRRRWPQARVLRWDADTARGRDAAQVLLDAFRRGEANVLVGTQMIAKGLDLPRVTLVGVVLADVGLALPDYRAAERVFQTLLQVAGRAGRGTEPGRVILQTYQPEHPAIVAAARHDYAAFYQAELEARRSLGYPPFSRLVRLEYRHPDQHAAQEAAERLAAQLRHRLQQGRGRATRLIGPAPCFFAQERGVYRWHIILAGPDPRRWLRGLALRGWRVHIDPVSLL